MCKIICVYNINRKNIKQIFIYKNITYTKRIYREQNVLTVYCYNRARFVAIVLLSTLRQNIYTYIVDTQSLSVSESVSFVVFW